MPVDFFGLNLTDARESAWIGDSSIDLAATPQPDVDAYMQGPGDPALLRVKPGAPAPTRLRYRPLTATERAYVHDAAGPLMRNDQAGLVRYYLAILRIGLDVVDLPDPIETSAGKVAKHVRVDGITMLSEHVAASLLEAYGREFVLFYGLRIWAGSRAGDEDFFRSSPESSGTTSAASGTPTKDGPDATPAPKASSANGSAPMSARAMKRRRASA